MKPVETPEQGKRASHPTVAAFRKALAEGKTREEASLAIAAARESEESPDIDQSPAEQNEPVAAKVDETKQEPEIKEMPVEQTTHTRSPFKQKAFHLSPTLMIWLIAAIGVAAWFYHSHEVDRRASEAAGAAAAARENQARSIVARVKNSWNADDNWEDTFSSKSAAFTPYTIELESALIKGRPIIAFGSVDDVRKSGEQDNSIVLMQGNGRITGIDLRFSLLSAPAITKAILNDENQRFDMFVIADTITSVEKVSMPPDKSDNDQDYFLAHGILHEAQPIGLWEQPPHK